jgi:uncharacterized protein YlxW (UPF0749 family)
MKYKVKYRDLTIIVTGILLGFLVVLQARSFGNMQNSVARDSQANVFQEIEILKTTNENLNDEITDLEAQLAKASDQEQALNVMNDEIKKDQMIAGDVDVQGPGVELSVNNNLAGIWLTDIVNELWSAGAEAVSVNGIRLTNSTVGFDTLPSGQISLNGAILSSPYLFDAIGDGITLNEALSQSSGIIQRIKGAIPGVDISLDQKDTIQMQKVL